MTVSSEVAKSGPYTGNGSNTSFAYNFRILDKDELLVTQTVIATGVETVLTVDVDYTVNDVGAATGTIDYPISGSPLAATHTLTLSRSMVFTQEVDLENQGGYYPEVVEQALDRVEMKLQEVNEVASRALKVDISSSTDPDALLDSVFAADVSANAAASAAAASETAAGLSETAAAASEAAALASENAAALSETNAAASETAAGLSEAAALASETAAGLSETAAAASETAAGLSETAAAASAAQAIAAEMAVSPVNLTASADEVLITMNANAAQTVNMTNWKNSGGSVLASITKDGSYINNGVANVIQATLKANASQTADLVQVLDSGANELVVVESDGALVCANASRAASSTTSARINSNPLASEVGISIKLDTTQTGDAWDVRDDSGVLLANVSKNGAGFFKYTGRAASTAGSGTLNVNPDAAVLGILVKADTSQSVDLMRFVDSADTEVFVVEYDGAIESSNPSRAATNRTDGRLNINPLAGENGIIVKGDVSQTGNPLTIMANSETTLVSVSSAGKLYTRHSSRSTGTATQAGVINANPSAGVVGLSIQQDTSQTANAIEVIDGSLTSFRVDAYGYTRVVATGRSSGSLAGAGLLSVNQSASTTGILVKGDTSQTGSSIVVQNVGGTNLFYIASDGKVYSRHESRSSSNLITNAQLNVNPRNADHAVAVKLDSTPVGKPLIVQTAAGSSIMYVGTGGTVYGTGAYVNLSDETTKGKIIDAPRKSLANLKTRMYTRKGTAKRERGFIAQELQQVFPEAVIPFEANEETGEIKYGIQIEPIVAALVDEVKELRAALAAAQLINAEPVEGEDEWELDPEVPEDGQGEDEQLA